MLPACVQRQLHRTWHHCCSCRGARQPQALGQTPVVMVVVVVAHQQRRCSGAAAVWRRHAIPRRCAGRRCGRSDRIHRPIGRRRGERRCRRRAAAVGPHLHGALSLDGGAGLAALNGAQAIAAALGEAVVCELPTVGVHFAESLRDRVGKACRSYGGSTRQSTVGKEDARACCDEQWPAPVLTFAEMSACTWLRGAVGAPAAACCAQPACYNCCCMTLLQVDALRCTQLPSTWPHTTKNELPSRRCACNHAGSRVAHVEAGSVLLT